jgi:hypothetical protein
VCKSVKQFVKWACYVHVWDLGWPIYEYEPKTMLLNRIAAIPAGGAMAKKPISNRIAASPARGGAMAKKN